VNLTLIVWLIIFAVTLAMSLRRPSWGVVTYMLTFFLSPPFWWWGKEIAHIRWNLIASLLLLVTLAFNGALNHPMFLRRKISKRFIYLAVLVAANATFVHFMLAPSTQISFSAYDLLLKQMVLFLLLAASIRDEFDLKIIVIAIVLGATYIGYEVTINERGKMRAGRLEGVGIPNAVSANDLACLMVSVAPLVAPIFLFGGIGSKIMAVTAGPLILNVVMLCNSRGAFLALISMGAVYLYAAPKRIRPQVYKITALGLLAGWMLMGDPRIIERFMTTFSGSEERDRSASSRMDFWRAGMMLIKDYPLGQGGYAFKTVHGSRYLEKVTGDPTARSVHQGYINEACEWGIQGLALRLSVLLGGLYLGWRNAKHAMRVNRWYLAGVNLSLVASLTGLMVQSFFGTFLDNEWGIYMVAMAIGSSRLLQMHDRQQEINDDEAEEFPPESDPTDGPGARVLVAPRVGVTG
jgi:putative inorganic carbon (hco3(-)) transporter